MLSTRKRPFSASPKAPAIDPVFLAVISQLREGEEALPWNKAAKFIAAEIAKNPALPNTEPLISQKDHIHMPATNVCMEVVNNVGALYTRGRKAGEGATSTVWEALDGRRGDRRCALKLIEYGDLELVYQEIHILQRARHPAICGLQAVFLDCRGVWLAMDYHPTRLSRAIQGCEFESRRYKWALGIAEGVAYLHANNILHRDLKVENILLTAGDDPVIIDFGLSGDLSLCVYTGVEKNNIVQTCDHRSPEVLLGDCLYGPAVDVWSLACVFWEIWNKAFLIQLTKDVNTEIVEMMVRRLGMFSEEDWPEMRTLPRYRALVASNRAFLRNIAATQPPEHPIGPFFNAMLSYNPAKRPTAADVVDELKK
jgi:serine/threonine protein kinase